MAVTTVALRTTYQSLLQQIEGIQTLAETIERLSPDELRERTGEVYKLIAHEFIPHAAAEDRVLYPAICRLTESTTATELMQWDHRELRQLTQELAELWSRLFISPVREGELNDFRRVLFTLHSLLKAHLAKHDEVLLPLLDTRLTREECEQLCWALEAATREAKQSYWAS
jgi:iron-sulfur cluster repair protein YtfE (RIC family)